MPAKKLDAVAKFLDAKVAQSPKTQKEIAEACGYTKPNLITMFKQGLTKLPLDKVPAMANALEVDQNYLMRLCLKTYFPDAAKAAEVAMGNLLTENEQAIIEKIRVVSGGNDPQLTDKIAKGIEKTFAQS